MSIFHYFSSPWRQFRRRRLCYRQKNTRKPNHYWFGLLLKFSAKTVHRVLSYTHLCQFFTVFPHFGGDSAGGGGGTAKNNALKSNHYWHELVLKFSAKFVHRVLSNTYLSQFFTVFPHFGGGSAGGGGGTAEKSLLKPSL